MHQSGNKTLSKRSMAIIIGIAAEVSYANKNTISPRKQASIDIFGQYASKRGKSTKLFPPTLKASKNASKAIKKLQTELRSLF